MASYFKILLSLALVSTLILELASAQKGGGTIIILGNWGNGGGGWGGNIVKTSGGKKGGGDTIIFRRKRDVMRNLQNVDNEKALVIPHAEHVIAIDVANGQVKQLV